jgi:hypothetical protein
MGSRIARRLVDADDAAVEQTSHREEDFSAVIRTMEELAGVSSPAANGSTGAAAGTPHNVHP